MNYYTPSGNLTSPGYPGTIPERQNCDYFLKVATAYAIRLVVEYFDTEEVKDILIFGPGPEIDENSPDVVELDGNLTILPLEERTYDIDNNQVWFNLFADRTVQSNGFRISWISGMKFNVQTAFKGPLNQKCMLTSTDL